MIKSTPVLSRAPFNQTYLEPPWMKQINLKTLYIQDSLPSAALSLLFTWQSYFRYWGWLDHYLLVSCTLQICGKKLWVKNKCVEENEVLFSSIVSIMAVMYSNEPQPHWVRSYPWCPWCMCLQVKIILFEDCYMNTINLMHGINKN